MMEDVPPASTGTASSLAGDDWVVGLLDDVPGLAAGVRAHLERVAVERDALRSKLHADGLLAPIPAEPAGGRLAAVDGAHATEHLYAGDLVAATAVAVDTDDAGGPLAPHRPWDGFLVGGSDDSDQLAKAAMIAAEVATLAALPHDVVVLDGSHQTPAIVWSQALGVADERVRRHLVDIAHRYRLPETLATVCNGDGQQVVACPKSDTSTALTDRLAADYGVTLDVGDRLAATALLDDDEMLAPLDAPKGWRRTRVRPPGDADQATTRLAEQLDEAIAPLRDDSASPVTIAYAKPAGAATTIKVEAKPAAPLGALVRRLADLTAAPHLQEPYPQLVADHKAKLLSQATSMLREAMARHVADGGGPSAGQLQYLVRHYRT